MIKCECLICPYNKIGVCGKRVLRVDGQGMCPEGIKAHNNATMHIEFRNGENIAMVRDPVVPLAAQFLNDNMVIDAEFALGKTSMGSKDAAVQEEVKVGEQDENSENA